MLYQLSYARDGQPNGSRREAAVKRFLWAGVKRRPKGAIAVRWRGAAARG